MISNINTIKAFLKKVILDSQTPYEIREEALELYTGNDQGIKTVYGNLSGSFTITPASYTDIQNLILDNRKIPAIKMLREITCWGLKESKDAVEDAKNFEQPKPEDKPLGSW